MKALLVKGYKGHKGYSVRVGEREMTSSDYLREPSRGETDEFYYKGIFVGLSKDCCIHTLNIREIIHEEATLFPFEAIEKFEPTMELSSVEVKSKIYIALEGSTLHFSLFKLRLCVNHNDKQFSIYCDGIKYLFRIPDLHVNGRHLYTYTPEQLKRIQHSDSYRLSKKEDEPVSANQLYMRPVFTNSKNIIITGIKGQNIPVDEHVLEQIISTTNIKEFIVSKDMDVLSTYNRLKGFGKPITFCVI